MKRIELLNPASDGMCRTIKANYWKTSRANFQHTNGLAATGVIEYEDDDNKWICEESRPTPQTKDGCAPAITATYEYASFANMFDTGHFPRMGVIEIGHYEDEQEE